MELLLYNLHKQNNLLNLSLFLMNWCLMTASSIIVSFLLDICFFFNHSMITFIHYTYGWDDVVILLSMPVLFEEVHWQEWMTCYTDITDGVLYCMVEFWIERRHIAMKYENDLVCQYLFIAQMIRSIKITKDLFSAIQRYELMKQEVDRINKYKHEFRFAKVQNQTTPYPLDKYQYCFKWGIWQELFL